MNAVLRNKLIDIAKRQISPDDICHDFEHARRVLINAEKIAVAENADFDVIIPAALFHDVVIYPKDGLKANLASDESAEKTGKILQKIKEYPEEKIEKVKTAIRQCSYAKGIMPELLEAKILQDADGLEAMGAIAIMRTFSYYGTLKISFFHPDDPFARKRPLDSKKYALDLFYSRLLNQEKRLHTKTAKKLVKGRHNFLLAFLKELEEEMN